MPLYQRRQLPKCRKMGLLSPPRVYECPHLPPLEHRSRLKESGKARPIQVLNIQVLVALSERVKVSQSVAGENVACLSVP